jgi:hypothetical protein
MSVLVVYARLYAACARRAVQAVGKSSWTLLLPVAVWSAMLVAEEFLSGLGLISGIVLALALSAIFSSYLYFVGELTNLARVHVVELKQSFGAYFWAVLNLGFVVWVIELLLNLALARSPNHDVVVAIVHFAEFVLLNAAPEVIYLRHSYGGLATVQRSVSFIQVNWIEWFIPNLALGAAFFYGVPALGRTGVPLIAVGVAAGALFHLAMVFRGQLFLELDSSSHRQRMFKYHSGS